MKRGIVLLVILAMVAAACGGSDDAEGTDSDPEVTTSQPDDSSGGDDTSPGTPEPEEETDEESSTDSEGSGPSTASVTLGGETYSFSTEGALVAQCQTDMFGIFSVQLPMVDESGGQTGGSVAIVALLEGTDPAVVEQVNAVEIDVGDEKWIADESSEFYGQVEGFEAGMSQVDSVEVDGSTVSGSATFVRLNSLFGGGEIETMTGTFEATCGEERIS